MRRPFSQAAGYRVGTFTSPHLRDYRERIRIDGEEVAEAALLAPASSASRRLPRAPPATQPSRSPSSSTTRSRRLLVFESARLDAWVLEVGMGGRLDAVNVVDPTVAVVVSIGLDHQEFLGTTLEAIAREKAGIFRAGARRCSAAEHARRARGAGAGHRRAAQALGARSSTSAARGRALALSRARAGTSTICRRPRSRATSSIANAATAIAAVEALASRLEIPREAHRARARAQFVSRGASRSIDAGRARMDPRRRAQSGCGARARRESRAPCRSAGRTLAVCGILADKDAAGVAARARPLDR